MQVHGDCFGPDVACSHHGQLRNVEYASLICRAVGLNLAYLVDRQIDTKSDDQAGP